MNDALDIRRRDLFGEIMMLAEEGMEGLDGPGDDAAVIALLRNKLHDLEGCIVAELDSAATQLDLEAVPRPRKVIPMIGFVASFVAGFVLFSSATA